jgi:hypothetical protein
MAGRFRFQFSLKSLMIFVTVIALILGLWRTFRETVFHDELGNVDGEGTFSLRRFEEPDCFLQVGFEGLDLGGMNSSGTFGVSMLGDYHGEEGGSDLRIVSDSDFGGALRYDMKFASIAEHIKFAIRNEGSSVECNGNRYGIPRGKKLKLYIHQDGKIDSSLIDMSSESNQP